MLAKLLDPVILQADRALRTLFVPATSQRPLPGASLPEAQLSAAERRHAAALLRIDHVGEVCAQALYASQALAARTPEVARALERAAAEEADHLAWCEQRLAELGGRKSLLNPFWYAGAWVIGALASRFGDRVSLGFVIESERQVEAHLLGHQERLPEADIRSRAIVAQMKEDEIAHAAMAARLGGAPLPPPVTQLMRLAAKVMTTTAYYL